MLLYIVIPDRPATAYVHVILFWITHTFFHIRYKNSARNYFLLYLTRGEGVLDSERAPAPLSRPIGTQRHERQTH